MLCIQYGDEKLFFCRRPRKNPRKINNDKILIKVHPDCRIVVHAAIEEPDEDVINAVKKRARWIYTQFKEFRNQREHRTQRSYVSGESHYYLGRQHMLKIIKLPKAKQQVKLLRGKLELTTCSKSPDAVKSVLYSWYRERAREVFHRRLEALLPQTLWVSNTPPIRLLAMKTQWGSCSPNGTLTLNPHLVKAPRDCIDYVLLHELCHLAEHNHSKRFYRLMSQVMPNWEPIKLRLDKMAGRVLADVV